MNLNKKVTFTVEVTIGPNAEANFETQKEWFTSGDLKGMPGYLRKRSKNL